MISLFIGLLLALAFVAAGLVFLCYLAGQFEGDL